MRARLSYVTRPHGRVTADFVRRLRSFSKRAAKRPIRYGPSLLPVTLVCGLCLLEWPSWWRRRYGYDTREAAKI